jgi:iron complex outermembrane receptor protein
VLTADQLQASPAQNFGDLLRNVPGVNVTQTSARDIQLSSRKATGTLDASQLVLLDGRTIYLDFFGFVLWDLVPNNFDDIKQIEVVRGPASAVWGANALSGVVNIITKTPRENEGFSLQLNGGLVNRDDGSREADGAGNQFGVTGSYAGAPNDHFSYRLSGGYFYSDPYSRPTGVVPESTHPLDSSIETGGATYPSDTAGVPGRDFENDGTRQPKADARFDHDFSDGGRLSWGGGFAGTQGIIHTGIGPFDIQSGSYMGYAKVGYQRDALKIGAFANWLDVEAPNLLLPGVTLNFKTQTIDFEIGHSSVLGDNLILSYGGNARRNNFEITLTPEAEDRNEFGAYLQAEYFADKFRLTAGGRVDKYGNLEDPVFSPRLTAMFKPTQAHSIRVSYNKAFRSPSAVNNFLFQPIIGSVLDLRGLAPFVPPPLQPVLGPVLANPLPLQVLNVGNPNLEEEEVTAIEVGYTGTFDRPIYPDKAIKRLTLLLPFNITII